MCLVGYITRIKLNESITEENPDRGCFPNKSSDSQLLCQQVYPSVRSIGFSTWVLVLELSMYFFDSCRISTSLNNIASANSTLTSHCIFHEACEREKARKKPFWAEQSKVLIDHFQSPKCLYNVQRNQDTIQIEVTFELHSLLFTRFCKDSHGFATTVSGVVPSPNNKSTALLLNSQGEKRY